MRVYGGAECEVLDYDSLVIDFTDDRVSRLDVWENV